MRAAIARAFGGPDVINVIKTAKPDIKTNQILVRNHAAGVNPLDTYIRAGQYEILPKLPFTLGKDGAGIVEKVGSSVKNIKVGDRVWYGLESESTAEYTAVNNGFSLPEGVSFEEGSSLGIPYMTAYRTMFIQAKVKAGDTILVHGASGGVGSAIMQLAAWKKIKAVGTASSQPGLDYVKSLNADNVYNHGKEGYLEEIKRDYPNGFNHIFEMAAHVNLDADLNLLANHGKIALIGNRGEIKINPRQLMVTEGTIYGVASKFFTQEELLETGNEIVKFLKETNFRPTINKEYKLEELAQAHTDIISNSGARGQLVVEID